MKANGLILVILLASIGLSAVEMPEIHFDILLDAKFYSGESANEDTYDTTNRYQIRKAAFAAEGELTDHIEYAFEAGIATCIGGGDQLRLMEAELMYELYDGIRLGLKQGHVLKGFAAVTECSGQLSMEKPAFMSTFGDCHPQGAVLSGQFDFGYNMALNAELSVMNGPNGTLNNEYDCNAGIIFALPLKGLSIAEYYNRISRQYYNENYVRYSKIGYRAGSGIEYRNYNVWASFEYFTGEGFARDDQKNVAWYAQCGYDVHLGLDRLKSVQPFVRYESWDRDVDADEKQVYNYLEMGVNLFISENTLLRGSFRTNQECPNGVVEDPDSYVIRMQTRI